jgi:hypothetical protein
VAGNGTRCQESVTDSASIQADGNVDPPVWKARVSARKTPGIILGTFASPAAGSWQGKPLSRTIPVGRNSPGVFQQGPAAILGEHTGGGYQMVIILPARTGPLSRDLPQGVSF